MTTRISSTVYKAIMILNSFLNHKEGLSVTQISNLSNINMSTVVRLCVTLEHYQYLKRNVRGTYFIGPNIKKLAEIYRLQFDMEEIILPVLTDLRDETGESTSFYVVDGDKRVCMLRVDSRNEIRHVVEEGARLPLSQGVVGPVLLAYLGKRGAELERIRKAGFLNDDGRESSTASVAAPVLTVDGSLAGALVVSGLSGRFNPERREKAVSLLLEYCARLRDQLPLRDAKR